MKAHLFIILALSGVIFTGNAGAVDDDAGMPPVGDLQTAVTPRFEAITDDFSDLSEWDLIFSEAESSYGDRPSVSNYNITIDEGFGVPAPSVRIAGGGSSTFATIYRTFDLDHLGDGDLFLGADVWIEHKPVHTDAGPVFRTPAFTVEIKNADGEFLLRTASIKPSHQWAYHEFDIGDLLEGTPSITILLSLSDWTSADHKEKMYIDNFYLGAKPPVITAPKDITKEATAPLTPIFIGIAGATDNLDPSPVISNDAPEKFPVGTTVITWKAADSSGNFATAEQTVTIQDTTKPVFSNLPSSATYTADSASGIKAEFVPPTATDTVDLDVNVTSSHISGTTFPVGDTTVAFTAEDDSGNAASYEITITVKYISGFQTITDDFLDLNQWETLISPCTRGSDYNSYTFTIDNTDGNPPPSVKIAGAADCHFLYFIRSIDVSELGDDESLFVGMDFKGLSTSYPEPPIRPKFGINLIVFNDISYNYYSKAFNERVSDRTWKLLSSDITGIARNANEIRIVILFVDPSSFDRQLEIYYDNFYIGTTPPSRSVQGSQSNAIPDGSTFQPTPHDGSRQTAESLSPVDTPTITITGGNPLNHEAHTNFVDPGASCIEADKIWPADASMENVEIIGTHIVTYVCSGSNGVSITSRVVNIVDTTNPAISLDGLAIVEHPNGASYSDAGATCSDNYDPDRHVESDDTVDVNTPGQQTLRYTCTDSSGNRAEDVVRTVVVLESR